MARAIATLFGVGYVRTAPGTVASAVALLLAWLIAWSGGRFAVLAFGIVAFAIGAWASEVYATQSKSNDPCECVIDELAGQWIACAFAPIAPLAYALAFLLFRVFDIWKPWPIRHVERLHGGIGIMADDIVAALMTGAILAVLAHLNLI
ncbi:MAG: phosphatidylglycerophosphatase A [Alphaproteobacteria bacterium]|nr:phosphatidylglycerophosphatase A [Alphaproteobacteria bacterium]